MNLDRFLREIDGSIKDLEDDLKAEFALVRNTKNLCKSDLEMKKLLCKAFRMGQIDGYNHVKREYKDNNCLIELEKSLQWTVKHKEIILNGAFKLENDDSQFIKIQEQGKKVSYEYVLLMLGHLNQ